MIAAPSAMKPPRENVREERGHRDERRGTVPPRAPWTLARDARTNALAKTAQTTSSVASTLDSTLAPVSLPTCAAAAPPRVPCHA